MQEMSLANEADCARVAAYLPGMFGRLLPGELCERYGVPSEAQWARLRRVLAVEDGRFVPRLRHNYHGPHKRVA